MISRATFIAAGMAAGLVAVTSIVLPAAPPQASPASAAEQLVDMYFESFENHRQHDLITRAQVQPLAGKLRELGYSADQVRELIVDTLPENDFLAAQFRTDSGRRFMRKVSSQKLIYDQLDRIAREAGGKALIKHLIRLPDGEQFVRSGRPATTPGMIELLPKQGSGKTRRVRDYDRPTGKIYTAEHLKARLREYRE